MPRTQAHPKEASSHSISTFETDFERLTSIVDKLESGNTGLQEMLGLYEEGMSLSGALRKTLDEAELKVEKLAGVHEETVAPGSRVATNEMEADEAELLF